MVDQLQVRNKRWDWDYFLRVREEVLSSWPTGHELKGEKPLEDAVEYQKRQPWWKFAALRNKKADEEGRIQVACGIGHALVEQMLAQVRHCESLRPDRWYVSQDTYTKKNQYRLAGDAVERSRKHGSYSYLNGYPVVTHGIEGARRVTEATPAVFSADCNDEDARLSWEIVLAGGWTCGNTKALDQAIQHCRDYPLDRMIHNYQYQDRLTAFYTERGVPILRRASANLGGWDSMALRVIVSLTECLLAAEQGVKYFDLNMGMGMNPVQDVAAMHVVTKLAREYLDRFGYKDVTVYPWWYFFLGDWPLDRDALIGQLCWNMIVGVLSGCNGMVIKSPDEATVTPTKEAFLASLKMARQIVRLGGAQRLPEDESVKLEKAMIEAEVRSVVEKTLEMGDGDLAVGLVKAMEAGVIDTQFSPYKYLRGEVMVVRDPQRALRYLNSGNIPLPPQVKEYHREKLAQLETREARKSDIDRIIQEATWASRPIEEEEAPQLAYSLQGGCENGTK